MLAFSILVLTAIGAIGAVLAIANSWRHYGRTALALRGALRECSDWQDVRFTITELEVPHGGAKILRPDFGVRPAGRAARNVLSAAA